ncbi:hypothetical protein C1I97_17705 [Streptomyces sp. NTH33]|uniref:SCO2400 family protein n=1 Tax=Streptomyces sp. NTH33 TaxID=1735453 RepID=UPI000DAA793E|nr:hypothetical protein [Streptomyces sp. NTH33]PZH06888.1 hypothetical protein C1I97_17705 [Streptomyces sp. NTH33]
MDYCSSCRRHLNGALVCPGCGAYAPDIAPPAVGTRTGSARGAAPTTTGDAPGITHAGGAGVPDAWHDGPLPGEPHGEAELGSGASTAPSTGVEDMPPARQGRAARRRQLARWKKNKRRAAVATAVALVGGGLTIATMGRDATDRAQAATAPDNQGIGFAEEEQEEQGEEQTPQHTRPAPAPPTTHRSSHATSDHATSDHTAPDHTAPVAQSPTVNAPQHTTPPIARTDATASPRQAATSAPQPQNTAPSSGDTAPDRTGTTAERPSAPAASGRTNSDTDSGTKSGTQTDPAPASTPPTQVCLLVLCLG